MSAEPQPDPIALATQLIAEGERMLEMGRALLARAGVEPLFDEPPAPRSITPGNDHSVGAQGWVDLGRAQIQARTLKRFSRTQFADALGLKGVQSSKWIAQLLDHKWIERTVDEETGGTVYQYVRAMADEDATYQVRVWAQNVDGTFTAIEAIEETGLPEDEIGPALDKLISENALRTERITEVGELSSVDELGTVVYRWAPPLAPGAAGKLERERLAEINRSAISVLRGVQQRTAPKTRGRRKARTVDHKRHADRDRENAIQAKAKAQRDARQHEHD